MMIPSPIQMVIVSHEDVCKIYLHASSAIKLRHLDKDKFAVDV